MIVEVLLAIGLTLFAYVFYKWGSKNDDYFTKRGIKQLIPKFLIGNNASFFYRKFTAAEHALHIYDAYPNERILGFFDFTTPVHLIRDIELIRQLAIKDFDHFQDHRTFMDEKSENLFSNSLFLMQGEKWRDMRATLSPAFTGSKMRQMFVLVSECADEMMKYLESEAKDGKEINFEMKQLFARYTNDVIASCAFGIRVNSLQDPDNEFFKCGKKFLGFTDLFMVVRLLMIKIFPSISKKLGLELFGKDVDNFFRSMVLDTMKVREEKKIFRPDMINILMQLRKGAISSEDQAVRPSVDGFATVEESSIGKRVVKRQWSETQIVAQCFIFFLAGFETSSNVLTMVSYELIANPEVQQKLYEEVKATHEVLQGKRIDYDTLQKMKYMDQVISETMRRWPAFTMLDRSCVKDYDYEDDSLKLNLLKGSVIVIPIFGIHHDPKYFPNPYKFDPDRFSDENKDNILPGSYIPFGVGPRNCIGSRFALMEVKAIIYYLLLSFRLEPNAKSEIPIVLKKSPFSFTSKNGVHMQLAPRNL